MSERNYMEVYEQWVNNPLFGQETKDELLSIKDDPKEIEERFYCDLVFGTAGLRGIIGAGTNRMNKYVVRKATQGLANYIIKQGKQDKGVAISHDNRRMSREFAQEAALCLAANGIKVYIFPSLRPTPELSFAVRELHCTAGIMVTASHNPPEYNGYKVYGSDGCQATIDLCNNVQKAIDAIDPFAVESAISFDNAVTHGLISYVSEDVLDSFIKSTLRVSTCVDCSDLTVAYSPLNGTGLNLCKRIMKDIFVKDVHVVPQQERADGNFPTCPKPNPENADAMKLGLLLAKGSRCDILIATDPDCDRIGVAVDHRGEWKQLA